MKIKQHDTNDCGAACLASVSAFYGLRVPLSKIRDLAYTDVRGTTMGGLVLAAQTLGFDTKGIKCRDHKELKSLPLPCIAHLNVDIPHVDGALPHYVVVTKSKGEKITIMDPQDGRFHTLLFEDFSKEWTGNAILLKPNIEQFKKGNLRVSPIHRIWRLLKPNRYNLMQALFASLVYVVLGFSIAFFLKILIDNAIPTRNLALLNKAGIVVLTLIATQLCIRYFKDLILLRTSQIIDSRLVLEYYDHLIRLPQRYFDNIKIGDIISRINDAVKIRFFISDLTLDLITNFMITLISFSIILSYNWRIALLLLTVIPIYTGFFFIINARNRKAERKYMEASAAFESNLVETFNSISTIKKNNIESFFSHRTENRFISLLKKSYRSGLNSISANIGAELITKLFVITTLWIGSINVIQGGLSLGELISFFTIAGYFTLPIMQLITSNRSIQGALIAIDRLFETMEINQESNEGTSLGDDGVGKITFNEVSFHYSPARPLFNNLNLEIPKNQITLLFGESGSGKSTIAQLLIGAYKIKKGNIYMGNENSSDLCLQSIRERIFIVPQNVDILSTSLMSNIALGEFSPNIERVVHACEMAGVMPFVNSMPEGLYTHIGERGASLSGGEKQKIAIARAIYRDPEVFVFDEATAFLDNKFEAFFISLILKLKEMGKTIIIISHNIVHAIHADRIAVLDAGVVVQEGSYEELTSIPGKFREIAAFELSTRTQRDKLKILNFL